MAKTKISEFSATANSNTDINSINIAEGCAPSNINDAIRELMAELKDFQAGTKGDSFNGPVGTTTAAAGAFTTLSSTGNTTLGDASGDTVTINGTTTFANVNPTLSAGTANGVLYLNGSKVATSGSALTFDGTNFNVVRSAATDQYMSLYADGTGPTFKFFGGAAGKIALLVADSASARMQFQNDGDKPFVYSINGSEQMRLTSTGLGIGTSSLFSSPKLSVYNSATLTTGGDGGGNGVLIAASTGAASGGQLVVAGSDTAAIDKGGAIVFAGKWDTATNDIAQWAKIVGYKENATNNNYSAYLGFYTRANGASQTEKMRLDSSGNLGLGVTPSAWSTASKPALQLPNGASLFSRSGATALSQNFYYNSSDVGTYIANGYATFYFQTSGQHQWFNAPSGIAGNTASFTQAMTLDASGNLQVGMTTGTRKISVQGVIGAYNTSGSNDNQMLMYNDGSLSYLVSTYNTTGSYTPLTFVVGGSERARINSSGEFSLGTTSSSFTANVGIKLLPDGRMGCVVNDATTGTNSYHLYNTNATNNGYRFYVNVNGGINNYSANNVNLSDRREKTDFTPAGEYLSKICAIPVQTYKYIDQSDNEKTLGVVAQDVQAVAPELVSEDNWGTEEEPKMRLSIYQTDLQYALMKSIQELKAELDSVKAELAQLKGA